MSRFTILSSFLCTALLMSACGTSGSASYSSDGTPTKVAFIKRADQICESTDKSQRAAMKAFMAKRPGADLTKSLNEKIVVVVGLPPIRTEVEKLNALLAPEGDEGKIQAIFGEVEEAIEKGEANPSTMVDPGSIKPFATAGKLAREYGLKACAFPF